MARFNGVPDAADYYLWVNDVRGTRVQQIATPAEAGCATGSACSLTPTTALNPGLVTFWVQARNGLGVSGWGHPMKFTETETFPIPLSISPFGKIATNALVYVWDAVPGAIGYDLWVDDVTGNKLQATYEASAAGCATSANCSVSPETVLAAGLAKWWVRARDASRIGSWSAVKYFTVAP